MDDEICGPLAGAISKGVFIDVPKQSEMNQHSTDITSWNLRDKLRETPSVHRTVKGSKVFPLHNAQKASIKRIPFFSLIVHSREAGILHNQITS